MSNAAIKYQFEQWISTLDLSHLTNTDKSFLNLLSTNFDRIADLGTGHGARAKKIGELIENIDVTVLSNTLSLSLHNTDSSERLNNVVEFIIGPFRGFSISQSFTFDKKYTFMYGPNGSGKSSFCEGLEYALLGSIEEADAKRIALDTYIRNTKKKHSIPPRIYGLDVAKQKVEIKPNASAYRFSFVEKNRIDGFARITATTTRDQRDRIATLFGLDAFSDFVDGFTDELDDRYITLKNQKEENFKIENTKIELSKNRVLEINTDLQKFDEKTKLLIGDIPKDGISSLEDLKIYLIGNDGVSGIINDIQKKKAENIPDDIKNEILDSFSIALTKIRESLGFLTIKLTHLKGLSLEINYKDLYTAIESIAKDTGADKTVCPACKTPIDYVYINPFENAASEIIKLVKLTELQKDIENYGTSISKEVRIANASIKEINASKEIINNKEQNIPKFSEFSYTNIVSIDKWKQQLKNELIRIDSMHKNIESIYSDIQVYNNCLQQRRTEKGTTIDTTLIKHQNFKNRYDEIVAVKKSLSAEKNTLNGELEAFKSANKSKIEEIDKQKQKIENNRKFVESYHRLIKNLKNYRNKLPAQLAEGLSDRALDYYNIVNGHDHDFEKLRSLSLPTVPGQKIIIRFNKDNEEYDALLILSEGHIKVLGLSILLAKAVKEDLGFLIFDDIVNAIDDDHRDGIAELLLKHQDLKDRQHIITCHGEMFINKLEHKLGASTAGNEVNNYRFISSDYFEERGVQVSVGDSKHYLLMAKMNLQQDARKDAATHCRQAIESISEKLWNKLGKKLNVSLSVKMRSLGNKPDLSSVVDGLIKEVKKLDGSQDLYNDFKQLKEKYVWILVNKGTHEEGGLPELEYKDVSDLLELVLNIEKKVSEIKLRVAVAID